MKRTPLGLEIEAALREAVAHHKARTAHFDAASYVSKNVHGGVRQVTGKEAALHQDMARKAVAKAKSPRE